ncbi:MAG: DUF6603 domain-containing protein [Frankiaceae bacterium]
MAEPGTLERIGLLLADVLSPLADGLQPEQALGFLGRLGLRLPATVMTAQVQAALGAAATAAGQLPALATDLSASISADAGGIEIGLKSAPLVANVVTLIRSFETIGNQLRTATATGVTAEALEDFATHLPERLLDLLLVDYLERRQPTFAALLSLMGVIEKATVNPGSIDPRAPEMIRPSVRLGRIGDFFSSPEGVAAELYGWGGTGFDARLLLERLYGLLTGFGLPVAWGEVGDPPRRAIEFFLAALSGTPTGVAPPGLELLIYVGIGDGFALSFPIAPGLELDISAQGAVSGSAGVRVQPPAMIEVVPPAASVQGQVRAGIARVPAEGQALSIFGVAGGTRLEAGRIELAVKTAFAWDTASSKVTGDFGIDGRIERGKLVISLAGADGFIGSIMSGFGLEADFDLGFGWTAGGGIYFTGSASLDVQVPTHITLGPVEIEAVTLRVGVAGAGFPISLMANVKGALGPLTAVVQDIGATATVAFPSDRHGNLGPVDIALAFKPPAGVGLSLDAGVVKGGGYLFIDAAHGEYAGALQLMLADVISLGAIGIITTHNPDGSPGFSLLVVITAEFPGGIQLGLGFTLLAVGGIIGINRTMNLPALMDGVRSNAISSVMFPTDIVANAPRIISDLRTFFPPKPGTFLIGPMLKLGWGTPTFVSVSVGVIIEIPGNIALVGILKVALPAEDAPLIVLQVNFAGALEFDKSRMYFFASLYDSRVLFITLSGEMGLLMAWGDDANFVLSVGGFHPQFTPPPLPFPSPRRIQLDIINTPFARITVNGYFAVTSNTAQFGAHASLYFGFSAISVEGEIGFDALFQFSPFHFVIEISASVSLHVFGMGVFSIHLHMSLEGPTPWRARGTGSISFFFFDVSADFDITWGDAADTQLDPVAVLGILTAEVTNPAAWEARRPAGANLLVTLRPIDSGEGLVLHPLGTLVVRQRAVPLDVTISKVGSRKPSDGDRFGLAAPGFAASPVDERFAMAQFLDLDDAAKLSRPSFERQHGGVALAPATGGAGTGRMVRRVVRYEEVVVDTPFRTRRSRFVVMAAGLFDHFLAGASVARSPLSAARARQLDPHADRVVAGGVGYVVASTVDNRPVAAEAFTSHTAASEQLSTMLAADPGAAASLHVIPVCEAVS